METKPVVSAKLERSQSQSTSQLVESKAHVWVSGRPYPLKKKEEEKSPYYGSHDPSFDSILMA